MIRVILCDDSQVALEYYREKLRVIADKNGLDIKILCCTKGEELLFRLEDDPNCVDIIYLDIVMAKLSGIDTAQNLRKMGCRAKIIYLTAGAEHVLRSFDTEPFYYIVKGTVSHKKFEEIFLKACAAVTRGRDNYITVSSGGTVLKINLDKVRYFEVNNRIITMHCDDGDIRYYGKLDQIEKELEGKGFLRIHRSFLVNCHHVRQIGREFAVLDGGPELPVSAKHSGEIRRAFSQYLTQL